MSEKRKNRFMCCNTWSGRGSKATKLYTLFLLYHFLIGISIKGGIIWN
nr:MAG TPA: hypothetical protein [Caudoviricetes sp.]